MQWVEGKVVLITGGTSGIGLAAATRFAWEGGKVVIAGRNPERGPRALEAIMASGGGETMFVQADVSQARDVEGLAAEAVRRHGRSLRGACFFRRMPGLPEGRRCSKRRVRGLGKPE